MKVPLCANCAKLLGTRIEWTVSDAVLEPCLNCEKPYRVGLANFVYMVEIEPLVGEMLKLRGVES